ncbi:sialidase family protein [Streptomyces sp. XY533]|uniref:sialidase family protein n=1 Tax=Streptomyces sp. XY533 TaxID=1519481 RepID=UPI001F2C3467|nr:sialidase family protein [Streptomyces sp. XY533]
MRPAPPLTALAATALLLLTVTGATPAAAERNPDGPGTAPLTRVSRTDPYANCTIGARSPDSVAYPGTEVEPYLSVDPRDSHRVVTVFQQDRWNDGAARGLAAAWTTDGRTFHTSTLPFSLCAPGGADYERASDPWVSTGPDGTVYASGEGVDFTRSTRSALLTATSRDGGRTWQNLTTTHVDEEPFFNDKPSLTADPVRKGTAYQVWDRLDNDPPGPGNLDGPGYISLTRDGGRTWTTARPFVDTSAVPNTQTIGHVIVVDPRTGTPSTTGSPTPTTSPPSSRPTTPWSPPPTPEGPGAPRSPWPATPPYRRSTPTTPPSCCAPAPPCPARPSTPPRAPCTWPTKARTSPAAGSTPSSSCAPPTADAPGAGRS